MGGVLPVDGGLTGTVLVGAQIATFAIGLVLAFAGERVHEVILSIGAFIVGAVSASLFLPGILLTEFPGVVGYLLSGLSVVLVGGLAVMLMWISIIIGVFISGATAGGLLAAYLTGVWSPLWIGGGGLIIGFGLLFFGTVGVGIAFIVAYAGQATGNHTLRDLAFRVNDLWRSYTSTSRSGTDKSGGPSGTAKFDEEGTYFDSGGNTGSSSSRSDPFIPENRVKESGPIRAWFMTIIGIVCFGIMGILLFFILGTPILAGILHPTARGGVLVVMTAAICGRLAVKFYRPYIAVSTAFSGSILIAIAITSQRTIYLLSLGKLNSSIRLLETATTTFFSVMAVIFIVGSAYQIRHILHSDFPMKL